MLTTAIGSIVQAIIKNIPEDWVKETLDTMIDKIEEKIEASENKFDDAVILPLLSALRRQIGITEEEGSKYADKPE